MTDRPSEGTDHTEEASIQQNDDEITTTNLTRPYKVKGEKTAASGVGVYGINSATTGMPIGVCGAVPNVSEGYGLSTPDDAKVEGKFTVGPTTEKEKRLIKGAAKLMKLLIEDTDSGDAGNIISGNGSNNVKSGVTGGVIGGGKNDGSNVFKENRVSGNYGTVGGGINNEAGDSNSTDPSVGKHATVGGGSGNVASGDNATIAGGDLNVASGARSTVGGGVINEAAGGDSTVLGGYGNKATGANSIAGGQDTLADADNAITLGREADANGQAGAIVFGNGSFTTVEAQNDDEFRVQGGGGIHMEDTIHAKEDIQIENNNEIEDGTGNHHLRLNEGGPLDVFENVDLNGNNQYATGEVTGVAGNDLCVKNSTASNGSADTINVKLDANEAESGDTANVELNAGANGEIQLRDNVDVGGNDINNITEIRDGNHFLRLGGTEQGILGTETNADGNDDSKTLKLSAVENDTAGDTGGAGDMANIELNPGTNNGGLFARNLNTGTGTALVINNGEILIDSSSARYKRNIEPMSTETTAVLDLEPRSFEFVDSGQEGVGLIAEEVQAVLPELVIDDEEGRPESVRYDRLGVFLVPEVRMNRERLADQDDRLDDLREHVGRKDDRIDEQADRIDDLAAENERLRERLAVLEEQVGTDDSQAGE